MPASTNLLIFGASTRAAAFSALRAGLQPWCADLFADADLRAHCEMFRLHPAGYPQEFVELANRELPGPWMYTGALENWPRLIARMASRRELWGNGANPLTMARSPEFVAHTLALHSLPCPAIGVRAAQVAQPTCWLIKPRAGASGTRIRFWTSDAARAELPEGCYLQKYVQGDACAAVYVGAEQGTQLLGVTRQLVGIPWLHARPFCYCGSLGPLRLEPRLCAAFTALGSVLGDECCLRGFFGVDCILRDGVPWPVEINPRYTASVEVLEYGGGVPALALHRRVFCPDAPLAAFPADAGAGIVGKAILFAQAALTFPEGGPWQTVLRSPPLIHQMPAFADIPHANEHIQAGWPILTFFARAATEIACLEQLQQTAADLDQWLFGR